MCNTLTGTCPDPTPGNGTANIFPPPPQNGTTVPDGRYAMGTIVNAQCIVGFTATSGLSGNSHACLEPGVWIPPPIQCIPNNEGKYIPSHKSGYSLH